MSYVLCLNLRVRFKTFSAVSEYTIEYFWPSIRKKSMGDKVQTLFLNALCVLREYAYR